MNSQKIRNQRKKLLQAMEQGPATTLMLFEKTGILRANICRYIASLEKAGIVVAIKRAPCHLTKRKAKFYQLANKEYSTNGSE